MTKPEAGFGQAGDAVAVDVGVPDGVTVGTAVVGGADAGDVGVVTLGRALGSDGGAETAQPARATSAANPTNQVLVMLCQ